VKRAYFRRAGENSRTAREQSACPLAEVLLAWHETGVDAGAHAAERQTALSIESRIREATGAEINGSRRRAGHQLLGGGAGDTDRGAAETLHRIERYYSLECFPKSMSSLTGTFEGTILTRLLYFLIVETKAGGYPTHRANYIHSKIGVPHKYARLCGLPASSGRSEGAFREA